MIRIRIAPGGESTPTIALTSALYAAAPDLFTSGDRNCATLTIRARSNNPGPHEMTRDAWYDLLWTHPTVAARDLYDMPAAAGDDDDVTLTVDHVEIAPAGHLPAPPRIPAETRIAAAPPVTIDHLSDEAIRLHGGADEVIRSFTAQRDAAIRRDTSADAYDWPAYAAQVADHVRTLTAPRLTAGQRAHVAAVRVLEAQRALDSARASARALVDNAARAGGTADATAVRGLLALIDPATTATAAA